MQLFKPRSALGALEDLLDKERAALLSGNFAVLRRMVAEKERLINRARTLPADASLSRVKQKADHNQAMLLAASQGVRAVSYGLARRAGPAPELQTYDRAGRRSAHAALRGNLERRA